jgi:hypothetical protein
MSIAEHPELIIEQLKGYHAHESCKSIIILSYIVYFACKNRGHTTTQVICPAIIPDVAGYLSSFINLYHMGFTSVFAGLVVEF